jgi:hypothetical protein
VKIVYKKRNGAVRWGYTVKKDNCNGRRLLVIVPHQDVRVELRKYSDSLIKTGISGVYPFPRVIPLASLSKALTTDELKHIAHSLRKTIGTGKFYTDTTSITAFPAGTEDMALFGPKLDLDIPACIFENSIEKIKKLFSPLVIGTFLMPKTNEQQSNQVFDVPLQEISFRAAAAANMYWRPFKINGETGYKWKIGKLHWLPKVDTAAKGGQTLPCKDRNQPGAKPGQICDQKHNH